MAYESGLEGILKNIVPKGLNALDIKTITKKGITILFELCFRRTDITAPRPCLRDSGALEEKQPDIR